MCQNQPTEAELLDLDEVVAIWVQDEEKMSFGFVGLWRHHVAAFGVALIERAFNRRGNATKQQNRRSVRPALECKQILFVHPVQ